jgi:Domain of unknown function (DUF4401)
MTIATPQALWRELHARGLVDASIEPASAATGNAHDRPWYISALLGVSGWFAGLFLLGFVALLFRPDDPARAGLVGAVLLVAAWGLFKADREGAFVAQLALALSIAGQCLMLFAMSGHSASFAAMASAALLLQCALALAMPNRLHRTLSTLFATIALALTVRFALFGEPEFWRMASAPAASFAQALASWLFAWLPIGALLLALIRSEATWMARGWQPVLRPVASGLIVGIAFATLASQPFDSFPLWGLAPVRPDGLALWPLLSVGGALAGMTAAFALRSRALVGSCVVAALLHVSHFYYALGASLLLKSVLMLAMGAAMLIAARLLAKGERS